VTKGGAVWGKKSDFVERRAGERRGTGDCVDRWRVGAGMLSKGGRGGSTFVIGQQQKGGGKRKMRKNWLGQTKKGDRDCHQRIWSKRTTKGEAKKKTKKDDHHRPNGNVKKKHPKKNYRKKTRQQ